jgi:nitrate reductase gamma subunit
MSIDVLFVVAPYAAALCFVAALLGRISFGQRAVDPPLEEHATNERAFRRRRAALAVGLLGVGAGHVAMLATPGLLRIWNQEVGRLISFELVLFGFGVVTFVAFVSMVLLIASQRHPTGSPIDWACYGLLLVVVRAAAPLGAAIAGFARDLSDQLGARGRNLLWPEED